MPPQISKELTIALEASRKAAEVVMRYYEQGVAVEQKADESPVTIADREAEALIKKLLHEHFPNYGFLGEETGKTQGASDYLWVIDPIDGTKNFVRHIPIFGILIGLMQRGECVLGVSNVPGMGELMYAQKGGQAYINDKSVRVSEISTLAQGAVSCGGLKHFQSIGKTDNLIELLKRAERSRSFGDAYGYHLVASGRIEAIVESKIRIWDIAAAAAIVEAAGGRCTDIYGEPITTGTTTVIASNGKVHEEIVKLFQS